MNIDMAALHAIEIDRGISVDELLETIKSALLTAYRHTEGHQPDARIEIDRKKWRGSGDGPRNRCGWRGDQRMG